MIKRLTSLFALALLVLLPCLPAWADEYSDTIAVFKKAGESSRYFNTAYGLSLIHI